jgi:hypothetical protein
MYHSLINFALYFSISWVSIGSIEVLAQSALGQFSSATYGEVVTRDVREMYDRGLRYLIKTQNDSGGWSDGQQGPGVTGLALMVMLASGEDPNYGFTSLSIRRALRNIILAQNADTGYLGNSMYHHGFGMLSLAEAYGAVDESNLWLAGQGAYSDQGSQHRSIGQALELAVRSALTSQKKNPLGAWRYSPDATDADTSVSGAVLVGLLASRNAGIEVPDAAIDRAIAYYTSVTSTSGQVAYSGGMGGFGESLARTSIASLVYSVARRKDLPQAKATTRNLTEQLESQPGAYPAYARYYQSQALFQADLEAWQKWNKRLVRQLKSAQKNDGSFSGQFGSTLETSMSLLALALNYRFLPIYER